MLPVVNVWVSLAIADMKLAIADLSLAIAYLKLAIAYPTLAIADLLLAIADPTLANACQIWLKIHGFFINSCLILHRSPACHSPTP